MVIPSNYMNDEQQSSCLKMLLMGSLLKVMFKTMRSSQRRERLSEAGSFKSKSVLIVFLNYKIRSSNLLHEKQIGALVVSEMNTRHLHVAFEIIAYNRALLSVRRSQELLTHCTHTHTHSTLELSLPIIHKNL